MEWLGRDLQDESCPVEVQTLGRTLVRWKNQIASWTLGLSGPVPSRVDGTTKHALLDLLDAGTDAGWSFRGACA